MKFHAARILTLMLQRAVNATLNSQWLCARSA